MRHFDKFQQLQDKFGNEFGQADALLKGLLTGEEENFVINHYGLTWLRTMALVALARKAVSQS